MPLDFNAWMGGTEAIDEERRAVLAYRRIQRWPTSVVFTKPRVINLDGSVTPETQLAAQIVRVSSDNRASLVEGVAGAAPRRHVVIFGVKDHPDATVVDADIAEGYMAVIGGDNFRVTDVIIVPGEIQALAIAIG